ncbi:MAG: hypothetical protein GY797_07465 [Deltaproteobacteria bacterium]|nr:hypothetical protein [Deltaproteobacteria bacterium]
MAKQAGGYKSDIKGRGDKDAKDPKIDPEETVDTRQVDPEKELQELKDQAEEAAKIINNKNKQKADLQKRIANLREKVDGVMKVVNDYGKVLPKFEEEIKMIKSFSQSKTPQSEGAIKSKGIDVDGKVKMVDSEIQTAKEKRDELKNEIDTVKDDFEKGKQDLNDKQKVLEYLTTLKQKIDSNLNELKVLKCSIEREEKDKKPAKVYFLNNELNKVLDVTNSLIKPRNKLQKELYNAWDNLNKEKGDLREKEENWRITKSAFEKKQNEYEGLKKNRRTAILKEIVKIEKK